MVVDRQPEPAARDDAEEPSTEQSSTPSAGFDNRLFWETRYSTDIATGSGAGSRGQFLGYKRRLLDRLIAEFQPASILDVGCGDIEVTKDLRFGGTYTGVDLSPSVIERNATLRPDWTFLTGDFIALAQEGRLGADLVLAFDVLIHQHDEETYQAFVRELINVAGKVAVMNGFDDPRSGYKGNVAFHEPLPRTVAKIGTGQMLLGDRFRRTQIVLVVKTAGETSAHRPASTAG